MIRLIIAAILIVIFLILSIPFHGIMWLIGRKWPETMDMVSLRVLQGFFRVLLFVCGTKADIIGEENIPKDRTVLYIINHRSLLDIPLTLISFPGPTCFIAKKELARVPVLNLWLLRLHGLFLDRENIRKGLQTILDAIDMVKAGTASVAIFPEGTRNRGEDETDLLPFHEGSFKIASKSGCPIIPVSINGSAEILEKHFPRIRAAHVIVEYGKPILTSELEGEQRKFPGRYVQGLMKETLKKNQAALQSR